MRRLVDTEEAARVLGVTPRAIQKWFAAGRLEGEIKDGWRTKGKLFVWVEEHAGETPAPPKPMTRKVNPGEPGRHIITEFANGEPVVWPNGIEPTEAVISEDKKKDLMCSLASLTPPPFGRPASAGMTKEANLPAIVSPNIIPLPKQEGKIIPEKALKAAHLRYALINAFNDELKKNHRPKKEIVESFLGVYNAGLSHPDIYNDLGSVARSTLYNWIDCYETGGIDGLAPNYGNQNTILKVTPAEQQFLRQFLLNQNKPKISDGIRKCKYLLGENSSSSPATLRRYVNNFKHDYHDIWTLEREGQKAWNDKCAPYADRAWWTLKVGEILVGDGHKLNFQVINPHTGKPCRAVLIMLWDWYSSYPVGWEVMVTENVQSVATALRNSIIVLGKTPDNVYLDNGKAFRARVFTQNIRFEESEIPGMFARLNINIIWAMKYNAQAKPIERIFGVLEWLERELPSYTGASINDKPAGLLPNEPRARKIRGDYTPKLMEVNDLIRQWRDFYVQQPLRGRKNQTAQDLFDPGRGPGVDPKALTYLMMQAEVKGVRRGRLTFDGYDYAGDCLYGIKPQKVLVRYSLSDRGQIYVFDMSERFMGTAMPIEATAPRDHEAARRIISERRRLLKHTKTLANFAKTASPETIDLALKREPTLIDFIHKEDEKKYPERVTPFIKEDTPAHSDTHLAPADSDQTESPAQADRPFFHTDYDKFTWILKQPFIEPKDQLWLDDLMENDPIYKEAYRQNKGD